MMLPAMPDTYTLSYTSPTGRVWWIAAAGARDGVVLQRGGIAGLVGQVEETPLAGWGVPGQVVDVQQVGAMLGTLVVDLYPADGMPVAAVSSAWRSSWSRSPDSAGLLAIASPTMGPLTTRVRLADSLPPLTVDPAELPQIEGLSMQVVCDDGVWWQAERSEFGEVTISNDGDVRVWPRIEWEQACEVTMPSGVVLALPAVSGPRVLDLDQAESLVVTDLDGEIDRAVWQAVAPLVMPEGVPPGATRTYQTTGGALVRWQRGYLDPWR